MQANKKPNFIHTYLTLLKMGIKVDCLDLRRLFSSLMLAATTLLLLTFAFGESEAQDASRYFCAQLYLTLLFTLSAIFIRIYEADEGDGAFVILRTLGLNYYAWYLARLSSCLISALLAIVPTYLIAGLFHSESLGLTIFDPLLLLSAGLAILGLAAVGLLLASMTLKAKGRELLFPLLFFPLCAPLLLAATQASLGILASSPLEEARSWLLLVAGFAIIYLTLGALLFVEILEEA